MNCPSKRDDWKDNQKINVTIALKVSYAKKEYVLPTFEVWHYCNKKTYLHY